jgi:hypothetical protein
MRIFCVGQGRTRIYGEAYLMYVAAMHLHCELIPRKDLWGIAREIGQIQILTGKILGSSLPGTLQSRIISPSAGPSAKKTIYSNA